MMRRLPLAARIALAVGLFTIYTVGASLLFLWWSGMLHWACNGVPCFPYPYYQWWLYLFDLDDELIRKYLALSGGVVGGIIALPFIVSARRSTGGWSLRRRWPPWGAPPGPIRTPTSHYGNSRFATVPEMIDRWSGEGEHGAIVVGEAWDPCVERAGPFYPDKPRTWGPRRRLLKCAGREGSTHWMFIAPSGGFKSMCFSTTLLHWRTSVVVLDPKQELAPMVHRARRRMGHAVHVLDVDTWDECAVDVLDWIDITKRSAETDIGSAVEAVCGARPPAGGSSRYFDSRGRAKVKALAAHMKWDPSIPRSEKTLERLRSYISLDQNQLRTHLKAIHTSSRSRLASLIAGPLVNLPDETFGGIHSNADDQTSWLTVEANAKLVSGNSFKTSDIVAGKTDVFISLPPKVLQSTPALARCLIWAFLNAGYEAQGNVVGRILFMLDEVRQVGHLGALKITGGLGRSFGLTLLMAYQSEWQIQEQWGGLAGMHEWFGHMSGRSYACVNEYTTAEAISKACGTYGGLVWSESARQGGGQGGRGGVNYSERQFPLVTAPAILNEMPTDAQIIMGGAGHLPARCARPIYFRDPKMAKLVDPSHFFTKGQPAPILPMPVAPATAVAPAAARAPATAGGPGPGLGLLPDEAQEHDLMLDPSWWDEKPPEK